MRRTGYIGFLFLAFAISRGLDCSAASHHPATSCHPEPSCHPEQSEGSPSDTSLAARAALAVSRQLSGHCRFDPECPVFFTQARRELGLFPAIFATADRITRSGRIGMAGKSSLLGTDGLRHEGPEAYRLRRTPASPGSLRPGNGALAGPIAVSDSIRPAGGVIPGRNGKSGDACWISDDYEFVKYLLDNDLRLDARTLLGTTAWMPSDTLEFLRAETAFSLKRLDEAAFHYAKVPAHSPFYDKSIFYGVVADAHCGRYDSATARLDAFAQSRKSRSEEIQTVPVPVRQDGLQNGNMSGNQASADASAALLAELECVQRAGLALLEADAPAYRQAATGFSFDSYALAAPERTMASIAHSRFETRRRRPALAAAMSAVVPGAGKIYAGHTGEGISAFIHVGVLGAITAENWIKAGPTDWKTILFGVATSIFYIGNIYGSYVSVGIYYDDLKNVQDSAILYNIHIPLRSIFR